MLSNHKLLAKQIHSPKRFSFLSFEVIMLNCSVIHNVSFNSLIDMCFIDHLNYIQKYFVAL
jgi:hypothetical protein